MPKVRSTARANSKDSGRLIEIIPDANSGAVRKSSVSTEQYWLDFYRTHDEAPDDLRDKIGTLNVYKKFRDVRAILVGFLTYHSKQAEPWIYEALALSIKMNQGNDSDVKTAMGYAADLAIKSRNPNHLVSVADQMLLMGQHERVGELLDQASELIPHRAEPFLMSINLAQKTHDPKRMGDSIASLLSLGWPGVDETIRRDARKQAETLAKALREEGRPADADDLLNRLPDAEARDIFARLTWLGDADLDLAVDEPLGATATYQTPRTVFGGSIIKNGYGNHPEEVYVCPRGFDGEYTIRVKTAYNNEERPALEAALEVVTHEGTPEERKETRKIRLGSGPPAPIKVTLKGGRRTKALPYLAPLAVRVAPPADSGSASPTAKQDVVPPKR